MTVPVSPPPMAVVKPLTGIRVAQPEGDPLAGVRDDVDEQILPIFLDEAAELFPRAGEELRAWRRQPSDESSAIMLRRTLHTFKGSARMAGAMRLGELTHRMESRLHDGEARAEPLPALFELLETDLDHIAFLLDALRRGEVNIELPGTAPAPDAARPSAPSRPPGMPEAAVPIVAALPPRAAASCRRQAGRLSCRSRRGRRPAQVATREKPSQASARCCGCAPTSSTGW